jgi:hypothetical protein
LERYGIELAITHEDITELKRVFDDRYVKQSDCNDTQEKINNKFANDDKRIDLILVEQKTMRQETKSGLKFNNWLTTAVLGCIITGIVAFLFFQFGG